MKSLFGDEEEEGKPEPKKRPEKKAEGKTVKEFPKHVLPPPEARGFLCGHPPEEEELLHFQSLLEFQEWTFAKTLARNPHHYTLRRKWSRDQDFMETVAFIRKYGFVDRFPPGPRGTDYIGMVIGEFYYWTMGCPCTPPPYDPRTNTILINRKPAT